MNYSEKEYDTFAKHMEQIFPKMFSGQYGGFCIGPGWWPIIETLCTQIQNHIDWKNETRERLLKDNPYNHVVPDAVEQVVVEQIKEKFGGLRFYFKGGDEAVYGMVTIAEAWASKTCEECGNPGKTRPGGWVKVLCDEHEKERQEQMTRRMNAELTFNPK